MQLSAQNRHWLLKAGLSAALLLAQGSALAVWTAEIARILSAVNSAACC